MSEGPLTDDEIRQSTRTAMRLAGALPRGHRESRVVPCNSCGKYSLCPVWDGTKCGHPVLVDLGPIAGTGIGICQGYYRFEEAKRA